MDLRRAGTPRLPLRRAPRRRLLLRLAAALRLVLPLLLRRQPEEEADELVEGRACAGGGKQRMRGR